MLNGPAIFSESKIGHPPLITRSKQPKQPGLPRGLASAARPSDEMANFVTHTLGFLLSLAGSYVMMKLAIDRGNVGLIIGCGAYCAALVSLYAASALSHAFYDLHRRHFYRKIDQICIFYLISGSYTPFANQYLQHGWWPVLTVAMWALSTLGALIIWRSGFLTAGAQKIYLLLGWLPAISLIEIVRQAPSEVVLWVMLGAFFYTFGTLFLWHDHRVRYFHAMWHTLVIAGSISHFIAILLLVVSH